MIALTFAGVVARIDGTRWWAADVRLHDVLVGWQHMAERTAPYLPDPEWWYAHQAAEELGGQVTDTSAHETPESEPGVVY